MKWISDTCSFVVEEARFDVRCTRRLDTRVPQLVFFCSFPRTRVLGLLLAHSYLGIPALDHQQGKVGNTKPRHGVLM